MEIWKEIKEFPRYEVSNMGRVRNVDTGYILKPLLNNDDYLYVDVYDKPQKPIHKRIHRLVAEAFIGDGTNMVINHIDGNKHNNWVGNLEWVSPEYNSTLASKQGLYKTKPVIINETGEYFDSIKECAEDIDVCASDLSNVLNGKIPGCKGLTFSYAEKREKKQEFMRDYQIKAVEKMKTGCILNGGVGSGKSRTGLYYYFTKYGGTKNPFSGMKDPPDLYIITTARKRDIREWESEMAPFLMSTDPIRNYHSNKITVDSWNNINKYKDIKDSYFIFDEDRVTGFGAWVKAFLKIAKVNEWIILSATAGDTWEDYIPVFIANGFYKNKRHFVEQHIIYKPFTNYPQIDRYINTGRLIRLRNNILVDMDFKRPTISHNEPIYCKYDVQKYKKVCKERWDPFEDEPIETASEYCYVLRKVCNTDQSRQVAVLEIFEKHPRVIIFYNFDYELDILKNISYGKDVEIAEWNGHKHQVIPESEKWVYLVQYNAGAEGWNCIKTDTIIFFSQNYSYKTMVQASGRIDRLNTSYRDLYYYHLKSHSGIDVAISKALDGKKKFNESRFYYR